MGRRMNEYEAQVKLRIFPLFSTFIFLRQGLSLTPETQ